jgi:hypothetical protein
MFTWTSQGDWSSTEEFLRKAKEGLIFERLNAWGAVGVAALAAATPRDSGTTAASWHFEAKRTATGYTMDWHNNNINAGFNVALGLQYGHGTGTGGYVVGRDYINPAIRPVMDAIVEAAWREVTS